jgi:hypothetical protein
VNRKPSTVFTRAGAHIGPAVPGLFHGQPQGHHGSRTEAAMRQRIEDIGFICKLTFVAVLGSVLTHLFA